MIFFKEKTIKRSKIRHINKDVSKKGEREKIVMFFVKDKYWSSFDMTYDVAHYLIMDGNELIIKGEVLLWS